MRADGLPVRVALKARVKALEEKLDAVPQGKGKGRQNTKEREALIDAHECALDELAEFTLEGADGIDVGEEMDDFDALMAGLEDEDGMDGAFGGENGEMGEEEGGESSDSEEEEEEYPEWNGINADSESTDEEAQDGDEPSSFSRIPTALVHRHLGLPTTAVPPSNVSLDNFPKFQKATKPFVVELSAGEMLYLPASWWHEVTSSSTSSGEDAVHMAFNYWFYPPDNLDSFEQPYEDALVWDYLRSKDSARQEQAISETKKRKGDNESTQAKKKSKR